MSGPQPKEVQQLKVWRNEKARYGLGRGSTRDRMPISIAVSLAKMKSRPREKKCV